jgi:hypothetical protein
MTMSTPAEGATGPLPLGTGDSSACSTGVTATASYNSSNQVSWTTVNSAVNGFTYDASGNTLYDGNNEYWYDAEGQLCAVQSQRYTGAPVIQYIYDAEGAWIGKGTLASAPSSYTATCAPPLASGFTLTVRYLVDLSGDQVTELSESGSETWQHSNVWSFDSGSGAGKLTATYDTLRIHYSLADPLGTKRVQANALGQVPHPFSVLCG